MPSYVSLWLSQLLEKSFFYGTPRVAASENVEKCLRISKGRSTRNDLYDLAIAKSCKVCMIRFLKDQMSSISLDLYEEILEGKRLRDF